MPQRQHDANDSLAVIPWYWRDWRASKARAVMSLEARSVFRELLDAQWAEADCALPNDDDQLAGLAGVSREQWVLVRAQVLAFFDQRADGKWSNPRTLHEWKKAKKYRRAKRVAGRNGGKAKAINEKRAGKVSSTARISLLANPTSPSPSPSPSERIERNTADPWSREASDDWIAAKGGQPPPRIFPALKRAVAAYGWDRARPVWRYYLASTPIEFLGNAAKFFDGFGEWEQRASGKGPPGAKQSSGEATMAAAKRVLERHEKKREIE